MKQGGIHQEGLKCIACLTMLFDHMGYLFFPGAVWLRLIGRIAFPLYAFLLAEGAHYTRRPGRYALRLAAGAVLSELPYDLFLRGGWSWTTQNVMVTLLLGFGMLVCMGKTKSFFLKCLLVLPFALLARWTRCDYGARGVCLIALFALTRDFPLRQLPQTAGILILFWMKGVSRVPVAGLSVPWLAFAVLAMIPISLYSGKKAGSSRWAQAAFYLFYPAHLTVLWLLSRILP